MGGITAAEAAEILGITQAGVHHAVFDGRLPKAVKSAKRALDREVVEQLSLERIVRQHGPHPYWVGTVEAADVLGVTQKKLRRLVAAEKVPAVRHRRRWYFRRHQLDVIVNAREARRWGTFGDAPVTAPPRQEHAG